MVEIVQEEDDIHQEGIEEDDCMDFEVIIFKLVALFILHVECICTTYM